MKTYNLNQRKQIKYLYDNYFKKDICPYVITPFACDFMSPIEYKVWQDIRGYWLKMYPQYPVLNYFLDFWDPINKIWIEVDWKEYHLDKEKDCKRQQEIEKLWWRIYRFNWKWVFTDIYDYDEDFLSWYKEDSEFIKNRQDYDKNNYINIMQWLNEFYRSDRIQKTSNKPVSLWEIIKNIKDIKIPTQQDFNLFYKN